MGKRLLSIILLVMLSNAVFITQKFVYGSVAAAAYIAVLLVFFVFYNIVPTGYKAATRRLKIMMGGYELLKSAVVVFLIEIFVYVYLYRFSNIYISPIFSTINSLIVLGIILILVLNGVIRITSTSTQLGVFPRVMLLAFLWLPIVNLIIILKCLRIVKREYRFETAKIELNNIRKESEICKTQYPLLMVHGIFWRDWQLFNYWGRIPGELIKNGAVVYYGSQQSSAPMEVCAQELKDQILKIIDNEKCAKVNIIAHSKGGLDARYTISCLGMDTYVASLTTICTPHQGCYFVERLLKIFPDKLMHTMAKKYNSIYKRLGDKSPDFYSGIHDLTVKKCAEFNSKVLDSEAVVYQSVASKMSSFLSAGFPLNLGYAFIGPGEGENDGFVTTESSKWGSILGCFAAQKRRGVSHGDMIDLTRENIKGFDVCECYVELVKGLKARDL